MPNPILIHINKKFHIPLDKIVKIVQKRWGSIWVYFMDGKSERPKIAVAKQELSNLILIINTARLMGGQKPILVVKE